MKIRYTRDALNSLTEIRAYIAKYNPQAASRVINQIRHQILTLTSQPKLGRPGRWENTRELVIISYPYIVAYRLKDDEIQILSVVHTSRRWPDMAKDD